MPMIVPHQSQVGIATANAGQAAPYRGASAFMTPGQAALPNGLQQLAHGMDKLGDALAKYGLDRMRMQNATDLLADKIAYEDALRDFDSNYRQTHQGVSARDAEEAYGQFHKEQYDKLQKKWGGNPFLMQGVDQMAASIRQPSMQRAVTYRDQQEEINQKGLLATAEARTLELFADPSRSAEEKEAAMQDLERTLRMFAGQRTVEVDGKLQWQGGRNIDAQLMALRRNAAVSNVEGLLAGKDVDGAQRALDAARGYNGPGSLAVGHESGGDPGNISHDTSGSKSYGLFQFNNMGGKGTANSFMQGLKTSHPQLYAALGGGKYAVGSAEFDKLFQEAARGPLRGEMVQAQQEHFAASYKAPVEGKLKGSAVFAALGGNNAFQEVMLSTAMQHGPGGANRILREAWGMVDKNAAPQAQLEQCITATYQLRGRPGEFKTALAEQKDEAARQRFMGKMRRRYAQEEAQALALARGQAASGAYRGGGLTPAQDMELQGKINHLKRQEMAEMQVELSGRIEDSIAVWNTGQNAPNAPSRAEVYAAYGPDKGEKIWARLETSRQYGEDLQAVSKLTAQQQKALLEQRKPAPGEDFAVKQKSFETLQKAVAADQEFRAKDPAGYLVNRDESVRGAYEAWAKTPSQENAQAYVTALRAAEDLRGMVRSEVSAAPVLPDAAIDSLAAAITDSAQPADVIARQASLWGSYWPSVERQLVKDKKLPSGLRIVASGMDRASGALLAETYRQPKFVEESKAALGLANADYDGLKTKVRNSMEDFSKTVRAQGDLETESLLLDAATRLALQYMLKGDGAADAAEKAAAKVAGERYVLNGTYRIPAGNNAEAVQRGAKSALDNLAVEGLALPVGMEGISEQFRDKAFLNAIRMNGQWVTSPDESGLELYLNGRPVLAKDGKQVFQPWKELERLGNDAALHGRDAEVDMEEY